MVGSRREPSARRATREGMMFGSSKSLMLGAMVHLGVVATPSVALAQSQGSPSRALPPLPPLPPPAPLLPAAPPPSTGTDVITLKSGELRGTILVPDVQVRIQLATGEIVTVPWSQVDRIDHVGAPPAAPATSPPSQPDEPASRVWVHVDAPGGAFLLQQTKPYADWEKACPVPCDKLLPTEFRYRVGGGGVTLSPDFTLIASPGTRERIVVDRTSKALFTLGVVGMAAGGLAVGIGLYAEYTLILGSYLSETPVDWTGNGNLAVLAVAGVGALVAVGGALLVHANRLTRVTQSLDPSPTSLLLPAWN